MAEGLANVIGAFLGLVLLGGLFIIFVVRPMCRRREKLQAAVSLGGPSPAVDISKVVVEEIVEEIAKEDQARVDGALADESSAGRALADLGNARKR